MTGEDRRRYSVGVIGLVSWDHMIQVESYPDAGDYRIARRSIQVSGGTTGNTAVALARLGADVAIATRVGGDEIGQRVLADLRAEGCDTAHIQTVPNEQTDQSVVVVSGSGDTTDRTIYWIQGARPAHGQHLPIEEFFARDLVVLDFDDARLRSFLLDLPMHVSPRTRIFGTMTYLADIDPAHGFNLALRHDYLAGNTTELTYLTGSDSPESAVRTLQREMVSSQVRFAAISNGASGCLMVTRDEILDLPAFEIEAIDLTGAGDAFAAGVAFGILRRWDLETTGRFANAMGALATRGLGGQATLPRLEEVTQFLDTAHLRSRSSHGSQNERNRTPAPR